MGALTYTWTGTCPLERRYLITKAISGEVLKQVLVDYDLLIFDAERLLIRGTAAQPAAQAPEWRWLPGVEDWFQAVDWTVRGQAPYLAFISHQDDFWSLIDSQVLKALVGQLIQDIHTLAAVLIDSDDKVAPDRRPSPGLLLKAMKSFNVPPGRTLYIGVLRRDQGGANQVLVDYCHPWDIFDR